jgi:hypothetical protein
VIVVYALLAAAFLGGGWLLSVRLFPWKTCPRCKGSRRIQGGGGIHRDCGRCGATGRVRRLGAPGEESR